MGHHHELPLTGVMELRPDQLRHHHEVSPRGSWNYILTKWGTTTKLSWNYVLTNPIIMLPTINIESFIMSKPCNFDNQPSHTSHMPRSC